MAERLVIHPLNRGPRPVRLEILLESGRVTEARAGCTYYWDFAGNLKGKDPLDGLQLTQRTGGHDFVSHAVAAARALEQMAGVRIPRAAVLTRNILLALDIIYGHLTHFYQEVLPDYVLFPGTGPFNGVPGDFRIPLPAGSTIIRNMWRSGEIRQLIHCLMGLLGGKVPHICSVVYGGVTRCATAADVVRAISLLREITAFINAQYSADLAMVEQQYSQYWAIGAGSGRLLTVGEFPQVTAGGYLYPARAATNAGQVEVENSRVSLEYGGSFYEGPSDTSGALWTGLKPAPGKTGGYSWVKGAVYRNNSFEVGALARLALSGNTVVTGMGTRAESVLGRFRARLEECKSLAEKTAGWLEKLEPKDAPAVAADVPREGEAVGTAESSRGPVIHYVKIQKKKVERYTILDPLSWNMCPGAGESRRAPVEKALSGVSVGNPDDPVEVYRVARSF